MRIWPAVVCVGLLAAPLVWGACTEPPAPVTPPPHAGTLDSAGPSAGAGGEPSSSGAAGPASASGGPSDTPPPAGSGGPGQTGSAAPPQTDIGPLVAALPKVKRGTHLAVAACSALISQTTSALNVVKKNTDACASDAECEVIPDGICLAGSCGAGVSRSGASQYTADRKRVTDVACAAWDAGGCATTLPIPMPSCPMPKPVCKAGHCAAVW
jgi:hypothetical protein